MHMTTAEATELKLNIGSGGKALDGYTNIDKATGGEAYPLAYDDDSVDEILASHILEHFSHRDTLTVLSEWVRVLKTGGRIRIAVPNLNYIMDALDGKVEAPHDPQLYLMGGQTDANDFHGAVFTHDALAALMRTSGLEHIQKWEANGEAYCATLPVSLNLEGVKSNDPVVVIAPEPVNAGEAVGLVERPEDDDLIKIAACMSIPRVGWNDNWGCCLEALRPFNIPVRRFSGAFWGHCMQNTLIECVEDGVDWALCIDYDSVFTAEHVDRLIGWLGTRPEIDALAALQSRRQQEAPLMTIYGETSAEFTGEPIKVTTAHFGLTLLRLDCLKDIPLPWFDSNPGPDGTYTHDERMDDDIYFWHKWRLACNTIYVAPDVRIGHLEVMVSDYDEEMNIRRRFVGEWRDSHNLDRKPKP